MTWSFEVTWQIKYVACALPLDQCPPNVSIWWLNMNRSHPWSHKTLNHVVLLDHVTKKKKSYTSTSRIPINFHERLPLLNSNDALTRWPTRSLLTKWKSCLLFHKGYGHQNWQDAKDLVEETPPTNSCLFDHMAIWDHVTNKKPDISVSARRSATKFYRVVTYCEGLPYISHKTIWSHDCVRSRGKLQTSVFSLLSSSVLTFLMIIETYWCGEFIGSYEVWSSQEIFC